MTKKLWSYKLTTNKDLFIPNENSVLSEDDIWAWYKNTEKELELIDFTTEEKEHIIAYYEEAGLFSNKRKHFFRRHYSHSFHEAVSFLMSNRDKTPTILDLGVGTGAQALLFSLLGAKVIGLDLDSIALSIAQKRHHYYEKISNRSLSFTVKEINCFDVDYTKYQPLDGLYSMFAFNMMQPSDKLMKLIAPNFSDNFRLAIIDGNNTSLLTKISPSRKRDVWSPSEFQENLQKSGLTIDKHEGKVSLPPPLWNIGINKLKTIDTILNSNWLFPVSHQILASKKQY